MASKSALVVVASVLSATLVYAQQSTPAPSVASQAPAAPAQPQAVPDTPFKLPLIPLSLARRPIVVEVDIDKRVAAQLPPATSCTTHKMPMALADPNFDSKMVIKGAAPKPPCT
jgi:hypothetical protein